MPLTLEDLIRSKEIEFFSYGRKLDTEIDFGQYNWDLVKYLLQNAGNKISLKGSGLENYLAKPQHLYTLTGFLTQLWYKGVKKFPDIALHINVDIDAFEKDYRQPQEERLVNGLGEFACDAAGWVPEMVYFEKMWNFALDYAVGSMVGYPGYEHPRNDDSFRVRIADLAENYLIGTPQQIPRYKKYALDAVKSALSTTEELQKNPEGIFADYNILHSLEIIAHHARMIAANVAYFSVG